MDGVVHGEDVDSLSAVAEWPNRTILEVRSRRDHEVDPGSRIRCIEECAAALDREAKVSTDLILSEFGAPVEDAWSGSAYEYVVEMLRSSPDEVLAGVHHCLGLGPVLDQWRDHEPWETGAFRLFISHSWLHREIAEALEIDLASYGIEAFVAHKHIRPTAEWVKVIKAGLSSCNAVVALLHEEFRRESDWCCQEVGFAHALGKPIVSVPYELMPMGFLAERQAIPKTALTSTQATARAIHAALLQVPATAAPLVDGLVECIVESSSYAETYLLATRLSIVADSLTTQHLEALEKASAQNSQVSGSGGGMPLIVAALRHRPRVATAYGRCRFGLKLRLNLGRRHGPQIWVGGGDRPANPSNLWFWPHALDIAIS